MKTLRNTKSRGEENLIKIYITVSCYNSQPNNRWNDYFLEYILNIILVIKHNKILSSIDRKWRCKGADIRGGREGGGVNKSDD